MNHWIALDSPESLHSLTEKSKDKTCLILKHSTTCPISGMAKLRLEDHIDELSEPLELYYLDLLSYRALSNAIAEQFNVHHESPQVLLIKNGECFFDTSHFDITVSEINEALAYQNEQA